MAHHDITGSEIARVITDTTRAAARVIYPASDLYADRNRASFVSDFTMGATHGGEVDFVTYVRRFHPVAAERLDREATGTLVTLALVVRSMVAVLGR